MLERVARAAGIRNPQLAAGQPGQPVVCWTGRYPVTNTYERTIRQILMENGPLAIDELARRVGAEIFQRERARGTWALEIATWGPGYFRDEATSVIHSAVGTSLELWPVPNTI
jgi:hypothetical protein